MGGGGASEPVRVLAIFGSESGTAKAAIKGLATSLGKDGDVQIVDIKEGNSVGALETLKEKCAQHVGAVPRFTALTCWGRLSSPAPGPPTELHSRWAERKSGSRLSPSLTLITVAPTAIASAAITLRHRRHRRLRHHHPHCHHRHRHLHPHLHHHHPHRHLLHLSLIHI